MITWCCWGAKLSPQTIGKTLKKQKQTNIFQAQNHPKFSPEPPRFSPPPQNLENPMKNQCWPPGTLPKPSATFRELPGRSPDYLKSIFSVPGPLKNNVIFSVPGPLKQSTFSALDQKKSNIFVLGPMKNQYFFVQNPPKTSCNLPRVPWKVPRLFNISIFYPRTTTDQDFCPQTTDNHHSLVPDH